MFVRLEEELPTIQCTSNKCFW